ncbi:MULTISPECIES: hypothetical protein [unclassified Clostridioides]
MQKKHLVELVLNEKGYLNTLPAIQSISGKFELANKDVIFIDKMK